MNLAAFHERLQQWRERNLNFDTGDHCTPFCNDVLHAAGLKRPFPNAVRRVKSVEEAKELRNRILQGQTVVEWLDERYPRVHPLAAVEGCLLAFPESEQAFVLGYSFGLAAGAGYAAAFVPLGEGLPHQLLIDKALEAAVYAWDVTTPKEPLRGNRRRSRNVLQGGRKRSGG